MILEYVTCDSYSIVVKLVGSRTALLGFKNLSSPTSKYVT